LRRKIRFMLSFVLILVLILPIFSQTVFGAEGDRVVDVTLLTRPKSSASNEYEAINLVAKNLRKIGVQAEVKVTPWEQMADVVWYQRESWDITGWQMTARPERLDPDEFIYNLFHSSTAEKGYNFIGYKNPQYDKIAEKQRVTIDREKRKELIYKAQKILAEDVAYIYSVHPKINNVYNNQVFADDSMKEMAGLGLKNFWTYINAKPISDQKDIVLNFNDTVQAINPLYVSGTVDSWITELIWDRLMRMGQDGLPKPWAAKSVEWLNKTKVKVVLREGMKWHDGKPVTVEDVKFSFEVPKTGEAPMYRPFVKKIKNIEITGDNTLIFNLKEPWAAFETASLAKINIIPKHKWKPIIEDLKEKPKNAESYQADKPIGSGPFKFSKWEFNEKVILKANKEHFHAPKVENWVVRFVPNMEATLGMLENGEINFLAAYTGDSTLLKQTVDNDAKLTMNSSVDLGFRFLAPNHRVKPFKDKAFRKATAALTNRQIVAQVVYKGFAVPCDSVVSPALEFWHNPNIDYPSGGVKQARQILKEAGYKWDEQGRLLYPKN